MAGYTKNFLDVNSFNVQINVTLVTVKTFVCFHCLNFRRTAGGGPPIFKSLPIGMMITFRIGGGIVYRLFKQTQKKRSGLHRQNTQNLFTQHTIT
jgi:hypothetical protein